MLALFVTFEFAGNRHAQCSGNGSGTMSYTECVIFTLRSLGKTTQALVLAVGVEFFPPTG